MPIRVLVVDDSALMRRMLTLSLDRDPRIEVVGTADCAQAARDEVKRLNPDVLTLDLEMPGMDGATFLGKLMAARPTPVIVVSTLGRHTSPLGVALLELGAFDFIGKPMGNMADSLETFGADLCERVCAAAAAGPAIRARGRRPAKPAAPAAPASVAQQLPANLRLLAVGASTGGVPAVQTLLSALPPNAPPIAIAQHMPDNFTARFAKRLTESTNLDVREATNGMRLEPGVVAIAPGRHNMKVALDRGAVICTLKQAAPSDGATPSVDVLFQSVASAFGDSAAAAILTGMGHDGAAGLAAIQEAGGFTAAQDKESCVVYGMSRAAIERGAASFVGPPARIAVELVNPANFSKRAVA